MDGTGIRTTETAASRAGRDAQLDLIRGIAVAGMFFFSFVLTLSDSLPLLLAHNVPGKLLPGDFVLSLFLFCSGISLAMVRARYPHLRDWGLWRRVGTRIGQMVLVSLVITPFSVGRVLGMDEMMLNVVLTIPALLLIGWGQGGIWSTAVGIWGVYLVLAHMRLMPEPPIQYLGGYPMAVFWLPMLLGGALVHSAPVREILRQLSMWLVLLVAAVLLGGLPDKMRVNPAFGTLSVVCCLVVHGVLRYFSLRCRWLEYFGSKPLRMWALMFCLLGPVRLYGEIALKRSVLQLSSMTAVLISIGWIGCCYCISRGWDRVAKGGKT
jgi:hypothetical protein